MAVVYPDYPYLKFENWWSDEGDVYYGVMFNYDYANNSNLEVIIPNEILGKPVNKILDYGFSYVTAIRKLTIPSSIIDIGTGAFQAASGFVSIKVDSDNPKYKSDNNCLIEKINENEYKVIRACNVKNISVPTYITIIDDLSFADNNKTETVHIPESVTYIGNEAFGYCDSDKLTIYYEGASVPSTWDEFWNSENCEVKCGTYKVTLMSSSEEITTLENQFYFNDNLDDVIPPGKIPLGYEFYGLYYDENFQQRAFYTDALTEDTTIYVKWEPITYDVTYNLNGGVNNAANPSTFTINNLPLALEEPTKAGYRFLGWYETADFSGEVITEITTIGDKELYARWELITYSITYHLDGGVNNVANPATYAPLNLPLSLAVPTKEKHLFLGWYTEADFSGEAVTKIVAGTTGDVTLYARWELTYTITYHSNGGSIVPQTSNVTQLPNPLPTPTKTGYTFLGWYYDSGFTNEAVADDSLTSDVTLYAKWKLNTYTITFNSNGGTVISDIEGVAVLPIPLPMPTKEYHTFLGWYYDSAFTQKANAGDTIESNVILYAKWYLNTVKHFKVGDVLPPKIRMFFYTEYNYYNLYKPITFPALEPILGVKCGASLFPVAIFNPDVFPPEDDFESDNYVFFSDSHNTLIKIYDLTTNTWLTSRITCDLSGFTDEERTVGYVTDSYPVSDFLNGITYEIREYYNIYFNNVYVSEMPTVKLVDVSKIPDTPPVPVRAGYTFGGWFNEDYTIQYFGGEVLTDDIDLYAKWELITYSITYHLNGGINNASNPSVYFITELPLSLHEPTKEGYRFLGWYETADFSGEPITEITTIGDKDLYARWELATYTITYNSNGGSAVPQTSNATQLPSELPVPTKARNIFVGWYYDSTLKQKAKPNDMINTNTTLYAKWYDSLSAFCTDIANLIREFENSSDNIKVIEFVDRLRALLD